MQKTKEIIFLLYYKCQKEAKILNKMSKTIHILIERKNKILTDKIK